MMVTSLKRGFDQVEASEVPDLDSRRSLHYVDGQGRPLDVRPWYRYWVLSFGAIAAFLVVSIITSPGLAGFDMGARQGGAATAAVLAGFYAYAWLDDIRHGGESRSYWVRRNSDEAFRLLAFSPVALLAAVGGIACAMKVGDTYVSGLFIGPGVAALFLLVIAVDLRKKQRQRSGAKPRV